jgi:tetraacyldisaccharide 4'-kinase
VISIGNLTVGGTGKTPTAMYVASLLKRSGKKVAVLSRGYGGSLAKQPTVVSTGKELLFKTTDSGDEPYLMAKKLADVPIVVGGDRTRAGKLALARFSPDVLVLDDGFQHLKLKRDLDILLIDARTGFGNGCLLPRGILREPLSQLKRAELIVVTKGEGGAPAGPLEERIRDVHGDARIFRSGYRVGGLAELGGGAPKGPEFLKGKKVLAVSGIADPSHFHALIARCEAEVVEALVFPDHHRYGPSDMETIEARFHGAELIVTTEKDGVKMEGKWRGRLPIFTVGIELEVENEGSFKRSVLSFIQ